MYYFYDEESINAKLHYRRTNAPQIYFLNQLINLIKLDQCQINVIKRIFVMNLYNR